ncbi:MAG: zinc ribbon domain-containing protein [Thermoplasmata archaeon]|nr:zinc ribbon domain-containing protein [Thermoplasmata archaeon]MCI4355618.1 zinc ribbon domain-containing protein [Thermoplasmata archaeon]
MPRAVSLKALVQTRAGKIVLFLIALATLAASFFYLGPYFAIPTFLLAGLGLPIYLGWKVPKHLAILGIAALLLAAPIVNYGLTSEAMTPSPAVNSSTDHGNTSTGAPVLTNATATPYNGAGGSAFAFTVDLYPNRLPTNYTPYQLWVYVSTCPGATGNSSPFCGSGYPFYPVGQNVTTVSASPTPVTFHVNLPGPNIWWWQMGLLARATTFNASANKTNTTYQWIFLAVPNAYGAVQGPITGTWATTYQLLLPQTAIDILFYPGIVFFLALLVYVFLKSREARRKAQRAASDAEMIPPTTGAPPSSTGGTPPPSASPAVTGAARRAESSCPKCGAVVYPDEKNCWKCGAPLSPGAGTPLKSGGS